VSANLLSLLTEFIAAPLKGYDWIDIQPIISDPSQQQKGVSQQKSTRFPSLHFNSATVLAHRPLEQQQVDHERRSLRYGSHSLVVLGNIQVGPEQDSHHHSNLTKNSTAMMEATTSSSSEKNHSTTNTTAIMEATALSPLNLSTDLTELFDATLNDPSSPLIPILNKKRAAEPANDMIIGNNKKGKQVTDNDVMHIPWNFSCRAKTRSTLHPMITPLGM
jgi:hypothetical protein